MSCCVVAGKPTRLTRDAPSPLQSSSRMFVHEAGSTSDRLVSGAAAVWSGLPCQVSCVAWVSMYRRRLRQVRRSAAFSALASVSASRPGGRHRRGGAPPATASSTPSGSTRPLASACKCALEGWEQAGRQAVAAETRGQMVACSSLC